MEQARPLVASVCRRVLLREQDVDDAVQRTFVRLLDSSNDGIENVDAWLTVTARNVCLDLARRESRERRRMARLANERDHEAAHAFRREAIRSRLGAALAAMDESDRALIKAKFSRKVPLRVLAAEAGTTVSTMSRRTTAAVERLASIVRELGVAHADGVTIAELFGDPSLLEREAGCDSTGPGLRVAADWRSLLGGVAEASSGFLPGWDRPVRVGVMVSYRTTVEPYLNGVVFDGEAQAEATRHLAGPVSLVAVVEPGTSGIGVVERTMREHDLTGGLIDSDDADALATLDVLILGVNYRLSLKQIAAIHAAVSAGTGLLNDWWMNMHGLAETGDDPRQRDLHLSASPVRMYHSPHCGDRVMLHQVGTHELVAEDHAAGDPRQRLTSGCGPAFVAKPEASLVLEKGRPLSPMEHRVPGVGMLTLPALVIGTCGRGRVYVGTWSQTLPYLNPRLVPEAETTRKLIAWLAEPRRGEAPEA